MELRQLRYFVAVARARNVSRAAEELHIAQPPLSRQIQNLEAELGVKLLDRSSRPLQLTEAGRFFYEQAMQILGRLTQLKEQTREIGSTGRTRFVIGSVASSLYGGTPDLIRRMRARWPHLEIEILEMMSSEQVTALKEGRIDLGFGRVRLTDPAIARLRLREEALILALPAEHPLASISDPVQWSVLTDETLILYPSQPRPSFADEVLSLLADARVSPASTREVRELQTAMGLVASGLGVAVVPASAHRLRSSDVVFRPIDDPKAVSPIIMSYRANDASGRIDDIKALIEEMYAAKPAWLALTQSSISLRG